MATLMSTKQAAQYLGINEKKIYSLIGDKGLPGTKVTGKWLFQRHLLDRWLEQNTENYPPVESTPETYKNLLIITGSNDLLLDQLLELFAKRHRLPLPVFSNLGSMGGIKALKENLCHICSAHLLEPEGEEYNFAYVEEEFGDSVVVVNFCKRLQAVLVAPGNPHVVSGLEDLASGRLRIANRKEGTGTRLLLDRELERRGVSDETIPGYDTAFGRHLDVGVEVLAGRADAGLAIAAVGEMLGLDHVPAIWERYDFIVRKDVFFSRGVQMLMALLHDQEFLQMSGRFAGYDLSTSGQVVFRV
ncbi:MAG: helix-turn-helix transcriptional regulator [Deltaproteobacteria bacterium]|nr:MAG: helix-turn-helix transcriptional regulator [Deltaproteobacteria bacterium]